MTGHDNDNDNNEIGKQAAQPLPAARGSNVTEEVIHLSSSDEEQGNKEQVDEKNQVGGVTEVITLSSDEEEEDGVDPQEAQELFLCRVQCKIVGLQHYPGSVHPNEFVHLTREPNNPYDPNAVRVDNMNGEKVGHIKREQAAVLSHVMDHHAEAIAIEAIIPYRGTYFNSPVTVELYGLFTDSSETETQLQNLASTLKPILRGQHVTWYHDQSDEIEQHLPPTVPRLPTVEAPRMERRALDWTQQQKQLDAMFEKHSREQFASVPEIDMPEQLETELYDHQRQGIRWLVHQETGEKLHPFYTQVQEKGAKMWLCQLTQCSQAQAPPVVRGSILADDMGIGKTIQTFGLILAAPPQGHTYSSGNSTSTETKATDIAAVAKEETYNWEPPSKAELKKKKMNDLRLVLARAGQPNHGKKGDLVDQILRKIESGKVLEKDFDENTPVTHNVPEHAGISGGFCTLIVAPVSVFSNWFEQVERHVQKNVLRVEIYHGTDRQELIPMLQNKDIDILLVGYHTLASDYTTCFGKDDKQPVKKKRKVASLFDIAFHRVVCDEAHTMRSTKTFFFKAIKKLQADRKLCLTGTPFVNRPDDIHSLFSFLNLAPLADAKVFKRAITKPIQNGQDVGLDRLRAALSQVALRRCKGTANIQLTNKEVQLRAITFPEGPDKELYDTFYKTFRRLMHTILDHREGNGLQQYSSILEALLRMRQCCCSGALVPKERREKAIKAFRELESRDDKTPLTVEEAQKILKELTSKLGGVEDEISECVICMEELSEDAAVVLKSCYHVYCHPCISKQYEISNTCPYCRQPFQRSDMVKKKVAEDALKQATTDEKPKSILFENDGPLPPKLAALFETLKEVESDEKVVIFSQFTSFLDLVVKALEARGLDFQRIDGRMNTKKRIAAMEDFNKLEGSRFMLCSLHSAGSGINLQVASVVFMMDTWWNSSTESQAMDRVHRIGQTRDVRVYRFVMKDSIEERMVTIQEAKAAQAKGAFSKLSDKEKRASRMQDLRQLLEISDPEVEE